MYKVGVVPGKFLPPHRGHLNAIINAATQCEKLYVVVSDHKELTKRLCKEAGLPIMDLKMRAKWLSIELQHFDHIKVVMLDESDIPEYPNGWPAWAELLKKAVPESFDVIFGGEPEYEEQHKANFPGVAYDIFDHTRSRWPVSATLVRENPYKHWDYILGSARPFFAKKVLIIGTESCGKTTLVKYLAKIYHTAWAEEEGRFYSERYLGGNEEVFTPEDFVKIALLQRDTEDKVIRNANKLAFFDTDATITQYYCEMYLGEGNEEIEKLINPERYDKVLMFTPDVKWVDDGTRFLDGEERRRKLHDKLYNMYLERGFGDKVVVIGGNYNERLNKAIEIVDEMIRDCR